MQGYAICSRELLTIKADPGKLLDLSRDSQQRHSTKGYQVTVQLELFTLIWTSHQVICGVGVGDSQ